MSSPQVENSRKVSTIKSTETSGVGCCEWFLWFVWTGAIFTFLNQVASVQLIMHLVVEGWANVWIPVTILFSSFFLGGIASWLAGDRSGKFRGISRLLLQCLGIQLFREVRDSAIKDSRTQGLNAIWMIDAFFHAGPMTIVNFYIHALPAFVDLEESVLHFATTMSVVSFVLCLCVIEAHESEIDICSKYLLSTLVFRFFGEFPLNSPIMFFWGGGLCFDLIL